MSQIIKVFLGIIFILSMCFIMNWQMENYSKTCARATVIEVQPYGSKYGGYFYKLDNGLYRQKDELYQIGDLVCIDEMNS